MNKEVLDISMSWANSSHKTIKKKIQPRRKKSRLQKIRDPHTIYPKSESDKIVFISNKAGNGFCREKLNNFEIPTHIPVESMFNQINRTCYQQWAEFHYKNESNSFLGLKIMLLIIVIAACVMIVLYFIFVEKWIADGLTICNYLVYGILGILVIFAVITGSQEHKQVDNEEQMVGAIKQKLNELNSLQVQYFGQKIKYRWSCHAECLWIAINL